LSTRGKGRTLQRVERKLQRVKRQTMLKTKREEEGRENRTL